MRYNPVIAKELKVKMRGWKSPALVTIYLGFLGLIVFFYFLTNDQISRYSSYSFNPRTAVNIYNMLAIAQFMLILLITPALTGGAISGERERQTLDLLLCTNLPTFSIVFGKLISSIAHVLLLIVASFPILGIVFIFGGIGLVDVLLLFAFYIVTAFMVGSVGLFYSSIFKKSSIAMVMTYVTLLGFVIGTVVIMYVWTFFTMRFGGNPETNPALILIFMAPNPFFGLASMATWSSGYIDIFNIFYELKRIFSDKTAGWIFTRPWLLNITFNVLLSGVLIWFTSWKLKPVKRKKKKKAGYQS